MNRFEEITLLVNALQEDLKERPKQTEEEIAEKVQVVKALLKEVNEIVLGLK